ncbi:type VI secretion system baseplate subunit TssF [Aggregatibacter actinomycetemcomitans]|uniref:type VI secretion system baseplate subunit TssF n=1 Tax=Aggregatibacter actinomycetemcomitans TaxID=714 RepID=UPI00197C4B2A|nr:type VI secretion system baseplate subunit TssF [Aggregatibacter actinomycetemcomitans]MBN6069211.1 type VI secretion system baseplate subunit TssF [Aggregatibacter actinomycetemcomitans]MBN6086508.1 type VI secretion system baseplate subunit TssF [Aggregatibacter actinomycetemcomitans]
MSLKEFFRAELDFLKKDGRHFSKIYPHLSRFLSDEIVDPEAERIIESFAFLTARLKEKLKDNLPEITQSMIQLLWPNYLRPLPSCAILNFQPKERAISTKHVVPKGTLVSSKPVDGTACQFQTTMDVAVYPLVLNSVHSISGTESAIIELDLENITDGDFSSLQCDELSFYLSGSDYSALTCYQWIFNYLKKMYVKSGDKLINLPLDIINPIGFNKDESLIPYPDNAFEGYRLIQEFFFFPKKFYFFKLKQLYLYLKIINTKNFKVVFEFNRAFPKDLKLTKLDFSLYCVPILNLFEHDAIPVNFDGRKDLYPVIPTGFNRHHFEIFDIKNVSGSMTASKLSYNNKIYNYSRFESFAHNSMVDKKGYYKSIIKDNIEETGYEHYISFISGMNKLLEGTRETISLELNCTNHNLPELLGIGDICIPSQNTPSYIDFKNITLPVKTVRANLDETLHWKLISNLSLNYLSLTRLDVLKEILLIYDFSGVHDVQAMRRTEKRLAGIESIYTRPIDRVIKGSVYRGQKSVLKVDSNNFLCEGELFLFGSILAEFFRLYGTINSFHIMEIVNTSNNEIFKWKQKTSLQRVI